MPQNLDGMNKAADAGIDAAAVQFDALRSILDNMNDEDDCVEVIDDIRASFVVAFNRHIHAKLRAYLDDRA